MEKCRAAGAAAAAFPEKFEKPRRSRRLMLRGMMDGLAVALSRQFHMAPPVAIGGLALRGGGLGRFGGGRLVCVGGGLRLSRLLRSRALPEREGSHRP